MHILAYTARLLDCQRPRLVVSTKIPSIILFLVLGGRVVCLFVLVWCLLSAAKWVSRSKVSVSNPSYPSLTFPWMEVDSEIYDGWL